MCFLKLHSSPNVIFRSTTSWRLSILVLFTYNINSLFIFFRRILNLNSPSLTRWLFDKKIKIKTRLPYLSTILCHCSFLTQLYYLVGIGLPLSSVDWNSYKIEQNNDYCLNLDCREYGLKVSNNFYCCKNLIYFENLTMFEIWHDTKTAMSMFNLTFFWSPRSF